MADKKDRQLKDRPKIAGYIREDMSMKSTNLHNQHI